ncbi:MAG: PD-(D/E)XK nuclease-like domain-containing protein [Kitasatospora sp.]|nr:PD-(D/E)XK nuclease-like domain-containing protein [Kitasatospora sp.]
MTTAIDTAAPRIVEGLPADEYHADPTTISSSGLRALLPPGCPAQYRYDRDNPAAPKREFDFGHAAHKVVLGEGDEIVVTEHDDWRSKAAREERDEIRAGGAVPLLAHEGEQVDAMAAAIRQHPLAGPLFKPGAGRAELSIYWTDPATGIRCRIRPDWLVERPGLTVAVDYKTTRDASPDAVSKAINDHGYHQQDALYTDGIWAALQPDDVRFLFVFQSKTAPYLITVREIDQQARDIGRAKNERALRIYADCQRTGIWPDWTGPTTDIPFITLPTWAAIRDTEEYLP